MELTALSPIAGLAVTDSNFIVGDGTKWVAESGNTARTSLGLGTGDSPQFTNLTLTGNLIVGSDIGVSGDTDLLQLAANVLDVNGTARMTRLLAGGVLG